MNSLHPCYLFPNALLEMAKKNTLGSGAVLRKEGWKRKGMGLREHLETGNNIKG